MSAITRFLQYDLEHLTPIRLEQKSQQISINQAELKFTVENVNLKNNSNAVFLILGTKDTGIQILDAYLLDLNHSIELSIRHSDPYIQSSMIEFFDKLNEGYFNDSSIVPTYNYEYNENVYQLTLLALN